MRALGIFLLLAVQANAETIRIGWSGPLTGNSAVLGVDGMKAAQLAVAERNARGGVNGKQIELLIEDDQYDTARAVSAFNSLAARGVIAVLMPTYGGVFAAAQHAVQRGIVVINPLDCNNEIAALPEGIFCVATESESVGRAIADDAVAKSFSPVLVIYDEKNPFMVLVSEVLRARLGESARLFGVDQATAPDFRPLLLKGRGVGAIVFLGHDPMGQAMRDARQLGLRGQFYTVGTITSPGFQQLAGEAAEGALVAFWEAPRGPAYEEFIGRFRSAVGRPPILELATLPTYDSMQILLEAIATAGAADGAGKRISEALLGVSDYQGLSGKITMDGDGAVRTIRERIYRFSRGALVPP